MWSCFAMLSLMCRMLRLLLVSALQEEMYLKVATTHYDKLNNWKADNYAYDWDNKSPALHVLFNQIAPPEETKCGPCPHLHDKDSRRCMRHLMPGSLEKSPTLSLFLDIALCSSVALGECKSHVGAHRQQC